MIFILWLTSSPCDKDSDERLRAHVPLIFIVFLFIFGGGGGAVIVVYLIHLFKSETMRPPPRMDGIDQIEPEPKLNLAL